MQYAAKANITTNNVSISLGVNAKVEQIHHAVVAAKAAGLAITSAVFGKSIAVSCHEPQLCQSINLNNENASGELSALLQAIYIITPSSVAAIQG